MSKTRIIEAVRKLDLESIKKLLADNPSLISVTDRMGRNLLHLACSAQCKELNIPESVSAKVVTFLLDRGLEFRCCSSIFGVVNCPTLIFSDNPEMNGFIKIDAQLLSKLGEQKGSLQRFFTKIHSLVENGHSISKVQVMLDNEKFWSSLKLVYNEAKTLISFSKDL